MDQYAQRDLTDRKTAYDVEKHPHTYEQTSPTSVDSLDKRHGSLMQEDGAVPGETFELGNSWYAKTMRFAGKYHIEQRGIERVPEDERDDNGFKALLNTGTMVSRQFVRTS